MATIRLTWDDLNSGAINETAFNIYRATATFDKDSLPSLLATTAADVETYDDETALASTTYYYMVEAVGAEASAFSALATLETGAGTGPSSAVYNVTIPSGKVGSDLTDFPLMIDLSDMPASFWANVQDDGGNIRAYLADGTTLIPHDVTYLNTVREVGMMYVKRTLLAATAVDVKIATIPQPATSLGVADANGRNAVWADYETVWNFPDTTNRTGSAEAQDFSLTEDHSEWIRTEYHELAGSPHQGIATDGTGTFISIDTNYLRKYTLDDFTTIVASNADPAGDIQTATSSSVDHLCDGVIIAGEFWTVVNNYPLADPIEEYLAVFNLSDLSLNRTYDVSGLVADGVSALCYNSVDGYIYGCSYDDGDSLYRFSTAGALVSSLPLSSTVIRAQGIEIVDGKIYISTNDEYLYEVEMDGTVNGIVLEDPHNGVGEGLTWDGSKLYWLEGDGDLPVYEKEEHSSWLKAHYRTASGDAPRTDVWTAATSVFWTVPNGDEQSQFLDITTDTTNTGTGLLYDDGPDVIGMWNNTDSWLHSTYNPAYLETFRVAFAHDGTTERKLHVNGTAWKDVGVSSRASGSDAKMHLLMGSTDGEGYFQHVWLRAEYMSDDWMQADADNANSPSTFYNTITED